MLVPLKKPPPFFTSASPCSDSTRSAVVVSISRMLIVACAWARLPPTPKAPTAPLVVWMLNLSMPPTRMYLTPRILPTLAAVCGSSAPAWPSPCSFMIRFSLSRSTMLNLSLRSRFSENSVSMVLRAAGPMSLWNHQLDSAWFSTSQIAMRIFPCARAGPATASSSAIETPRHQRKRTLMACLSSKPYNERPELRRDKERYRLSKPRLSFVKQFVAIRGRLPAGSARQDTSLTRTGSSGFSPDADRSRIRMRFDPGAPCC